MGRYPLRKEDVVESFIRSSGPGGQKVNKSSSCVELWHGPTGIRIKCQVHRSQVLNRQEAWRLLAEAIDQKYEKEYVRLKQAKQKIKRQNRRPSATSKERMLKDKHQRAIKKGNRRKNGYDEE